MPDSALQAVVIAIIRKTVRTVSPLLLKQTMLGRPLPKPATGQDPVVYLHGVTDSAIGARSLTPSLGRDGIRMFAPTLPNSGLTGVVENARFLHEYIQQVKRETGAKKVDLVGHSQGGFTIRAYLKLYGGRDVDMAVAMAAPLYGVNFWGPIVDALKAIPLIGSAMPLGISELMENSWTTKWLGNGVDAPGVRYVSISSKSWDLVVNPVASQRWKVPGAQNIILAGEKRKFGMRGPDHLDINLKSHEAYEALRAALLAPRSAVAPLVASGRRGIATRGQ